MVGSVNSVKIYLKPKPNIWLFLSWTWNWPLSTFGAARGPSGRAGTVGQIGWPRSLNSPMCSYEKASGQQLNRNKTDIFFSKSTPPNILDQIKDSLGVQEIKQYEKYLGLLSLMGKNKKASLLYIKERVLAKLQGWKEQLLSQTGCEVLLKVVI